MEMAYNNSSSLPGIENFPVYIVYSVGGIIIGASNMLIFSSIARYEALRTNKVYVLIMAQSLADSTHMLAFTTAGIAQQNKLTTYRVAGYHVPDEDRRTNKQKTRTVMR